MCALTQAAFLASNFIIPTGSCFKGSLFIIYDTLRTRQKRAKLMNQVSWFFSKPSTALCHLLFVMMLSLCFVESFNCLLSILFFHNYSFWALSACLISWGQLPILWLPCQRRNPMSYTEPRATQKAVKHRPSSFKLELLHASSMYLLPCTTSWQSNMAGTRGRWRENVLHISSSPLL